jgi:hypothetical protein
VEEEIAKGLTDQLRYFCLFADCDLLRDAIGYGEIRAEVGSFFKR